MPKLSKFRVLIRRLSAAFVRLNVALILSACSLDVATVDLGGAEATAEPVAPPTPAGFLGELPPGWVEAMDVMRGICFESAQGAAFDEAVFVLRSEADLTRLFDLSDNSGLCRRPVERVPFDFSGGLTLVGLWSDGFGCTARHDLVDVERDEAAQTLAIRLRFITEGDCPYELVRPWWVAIPDLDGVTVTVTVEEAA